MSGFTKDNMGGQFFFKSKRLPFLLFLALCFTNQMNFRGSEVIASGNVDIQVFIRLFVLGACFMLCLPFYKQFVRMILAFPSFFHVLLLVYLLVVTLLPHSINFYSIYALLTLFMLFYVMSIFVAQLGIDRAIYYYVLGIGVFCLVSILLYYISPDIGRYSFWYNDELFQGTRMSGISGHPNTLGFMTASALIGALHLVLKHYRVNKIFYFFVPLILFCLVLTNSRTSMASLILMFGLYASLHFRLFSVAFILGIIGALVLVLALEFSPNILNDVLTGMSRSGNVDEITSLTGRSHIWDQVFIFIEQRPVLGWGYGTIGDVLYAHRYEVGFHVGQAHNIFLQILFSGGVIGPFIYIIGYVFSIFIAVLKALRLNRTAFELCILLYILLSGMTETIILSNVANNAYLVFSMCIASLSVFSIEYKKGK